MYLIKGALMALFAVSVPAMAVTAYSIPESVDLSGRVVVSVSDSGVVKFQTVDGTWVEGKAIEQAAADASQNGLVQNVFFRDYPQDDYYYGYRRPYPRYYRPNPCRCYYGGDDGGYLDDGYSRRHRKHVREEEHTKIYEFDEDNSDSGRRIERTPDDGGYYDDYDN
jgi:hypothetical protein